MSEAPERIWAYPSHVTGWNSAIAHDRPIINSVEFTRDDIHRAEVEAAVKRAIEACAEEVKAKAKPHVRERLKMRLAKRGYRMRDPILARSYLRAANNIRAIASDPEAIAKIVSGK
jgi:hypothetical protein